jgi:pimeloyl-ACP methyl ester carboxylesterase
MDTVLLITGAGEAAAARLRTVPALGERHRVLTLHVAGHPAQLADEAVGMLGAAGVDSAHVYGVSFGGIVAQHIAARHPDRVRRLVLAATPAGVEPDVATRGFLERREHMPPAEALWAAVPYTYAVATRRGAADRIGEDIVEALRLVLELDEPSAPTAPLTGIAAPTLVLHGAEDILVPPANADVLAAALPRADRLELEGAAHLYATDVPEADRAVARFLSARAGAAARRRRARSARAGRA